MLCLKVGNKNDDPERKVVETEDAYKFAGQMGIQLFETSAKENVNVEEVSPRSRDREGVGPALPHHTLLLPPLACCRHQVADRTCHSSCQALKVRAQSEQSSQVDYSVSNGKQRLQLKEVPAR